MTIGERLLDLTLEYKDTLEVRALMDEIDGSLLGREPAIIAAEYERVLRGLLSGA